MITYKNKIWDALITFIRAISEYPPFKEYENGRYKKRNETIYKKALSQSYLRQSDIDLVKDTLMFINEKDVTEEMTAIMDLSKKYNMECLTTKDGELIYKKAEEEYREIKLKEAIAQEVFEAEQNALIAKEEHDRYLLEHAKTLKNLEEANKQLSLQKRKLRKITLEGKKTLKEKEAVNA